MSDKNRRDWDDDITRLFRSNENKLDEMPSHQVWMRLERRLDSRRQYKRSNHLSRYTTMVAAVVAAMLMITIVSLWKPLGLANDQNDMAQNKNVEEETIENPSTISPIENEESEEEEAVPMDESVKNIIKNTDKKSEKKSTQPTTKRKENQGFKAPAAKSTTSGNYNPSPLMTEEMAIEQENEDEDIAPPITSFGTKEKTKSTGINTSPPATPMPRPTSTTRDFKEELEDLTIADTEAPAKPKPKSTYRVPTETKRPSASYAEKEEKAMSKRVGASKTKKERNKKNKKDVAEKAVDADREKVADIQDFHWLVGNWEDETLDGNSYENWALNSGVLQGEGYLISNGDTSFIEKMQIRQINNEIYFYTSVEKPNQGTRYKLISFNEDQATFENKELTYPNQIILLKNNTNNFQTIFQNDQGSMNPTQVETLGRRNRIERERAVRNLLRIKKRDKK